MLVFGGRYPYHLELTIELTGVHFIIFLSFSLALMLQGSASNEGVFGTSLFFATASPVAACLFLLPYLLSNTAKAQPTQTV